MWNSGNEKMMRDIFRGVAMLVMWALMLVAFGIIGRLIYEPLRFGFRLLG